MLRKVVGNAENGSREEKEAFVGKRRETRRAVRFLETERDDDRKASKRDETKKKHTRSLERDDNDGDDDDHNDGVSSETKVDDRKAKNSTSRRRDRRVVRPMVASELLGKEGSSATNPDSMDILRRVSILVAQRVVAGERAIRDRLRTPHQRMNTPPFGTAPSDGGKRARERYNVSMEFDERHFVRPQRRYYVNSLPGLNLFTCFHLSYVKPPRQNLSSKTIFEFIERLFKRAKLDPGCSIICLIYVERLINKTGLYLLRRNWRPIMLCSMLVASKMWQDYGCWNAEFSKIYPQFSCSSIKRLERKFISKLEWNTVVNSNLYSKYYFGMRSMNAKKKFRNKYLNILGVKAALPRARRIKIKTKEKPAMAMARSM